MNTWRCYAASVAFAATKHMICIFNAAASARYIRVYRFFGFPTGTFGIFSTLLQLRIARIITSLTPGTTITPVAHNAGNTSLDANTTSGTGSTTTLGNFYRGMYISTEEIAITAFDLDNIWCLVPFAELWNAGYGDSNVEPLTCVPATAEGWSCYSTSALTSSAWDFEIEFTDAAT